MQRHRLLSALALLAVGAFPRVAAASGWADYADVFPAFPCPDGWSACHLGGTALDPDLKPDAEGRLQPADQRVGWFDLQSTAAFSPFSALSDYPVLASAVESAATEAVPQSPDAEPFVVSEATPVAYEPVEAREIRAPEKGPVSEEEPVAVAKVPEREDPRPETVAPAKDEPVAVTVEPRKEVDPPKEDVVASLDRAAEPEGCEDLVRLESSALLGRLSEGQVGCLEASFAVATKQTDKDKISRVLLANAYQTDKAEWERLARRHLDQVSRSDPDICYALAARLGKRGASQADEVILWSDVALENASVWSGDTYKRRVYTLYKMRAAAAQELWKAAEERHASSPSSATSAEAERARGVTKTYAREWFDYAKAAGMDTTTAMEVCMAAAGTEAFCSGG